MQKIKFDEKIREYGYDVLILFYSIMLVLDICGYSIKDWPMFLWVIIHLLLLGAFVIFIGYLRNMPMKEYKKHLTTLLITIFIGLYFILLLADFIFN